MSDLLCIGHRGASGHEPENTLRSIRRAIELGVDGIELDVYNVKGNLVVIHDNKLDRTTNGHGYVMRKTFDYLRSLDAGHGEQIPTLAEVFDIVDRRAFINIELKGVHTAELVADLIDRYVKELGWVREDFLVSSFRRRQLKKIVSREIRIGVLFHRLPRGFARIARGLGAWSVHLNRRFVSLRAVERAHAEGLKVLVYTVNKSEHLDQMRAFGVDGVFTDFPESFQRAFVAKHDCS